MRWFNLFEYTKTKTGEPITFKYREDIGKDNRGWIVHRIDAFVSGEPAGYLKISYIPRDRFEKYYPTIFNYLTQIQGNSYLPYKLQAKHYKTLSDKDLLELVKNTHHITRHYYIDNLDANKEYTQNELLQIIKKIEAMMLEGEPGKKFKRFEELFVDKPYVDYIHVYNPSTDSLDKDRGYTKDYRRNRVGLALYAAGARWMDSMGMKLHASSTQTKLAQNAWKGMAAKGWVDYSDDKPAINVRNLPKE